MSKNLKPREDIGGASSEEDETRCASPPRKLPKRQETSAAIEQAAATPERAKADPGKTQLEGKGGYNPTADASVEIYEVKKQHKCGGDVQCIKQGGVCVLLTIGDEGCAPFWKHKWCARGRKCGYHHVFSWGKSLFRSKVPWSPGMGKDDYETKIKAHYNAQLEKEQLEFGEQQRKKEDAICKAAVAKGEVTVDDSEHAERQLRSLAHVKKVFDANCKKRKKAQKLKQEKKGKK